MVSSCDVTNNLVTKMVGIADLIVSRGNEAAGFEEGHPVVTRAGVAT